MDDIFVTQPFTARHVRFTKKLGFGSLGITCKQSMLYEQFGAFGSLYIFWTMFLYATLYV